MKRILGICLAICLITSNAYGGSGYDGAVKFLSHFNGATGDKPTPATTGQVITYVGTAQVSTATTEPLTNPPDTAVLLLDGDSDWLTIPDSPDWYWDGDFTIDGWFYWNSVAASTTLLSQFETEDDIKGWRLEWQLGATTLNFGMTTAATYGGPSGFNVSVVWTPTINTWYHIAVTKSGTTYRIYVDGIEETSSVVAVALVNMANDLYIGARRGYAAQNHFAFNGYIDELRISKGIARWTADFSTSLPTREYIKYIPEASST